MTTNINNTDYRTIDGVPFQVLSTSLDYPKPIAIYADGQVWRLDSDLRCHENAGVSLVRNASEQTYFLNVYRAADGGVCFGRERYKSNDARMETRDADRALYGLRVAINEQNHTATAELV